MRQNGLKWDKIENNRKEWDKMDKRESYRLTGYVPTDVFEGIETIKQELAAVYGKASYGMAVTELWRRYVDMLENKEKGE